MFESNTAIAGNQEEVITPPKSIAIILTERCNARCIYCPYHNKILKFPNEPSTESLIRLFVEAAEYGVSEVRLSGGEPLLRKDITPLIQEATRLGLMSSMVTNGVLLNMDLLQHLIQAGLGAITLSIDSLTPEVYEYCRGISFEKVSQALENIYRIKADHYSLWVGVTVVITRANVMELPGIVQSLSEKVIPVQFQPCHSYSAEHENDHLRPSADQIKEIIDDLLQMRADGYLINNSEEYLNGIPTYFSTYSPPTSFRCQIPWTLAVFDSDLLLRPCCFVQPPVDSATGNSLQQLWTSQSMNTWRRRIMNGKCPGCWLISLDTWK